ncbi:hypothetical protein RB597_000828 [Gaeumannomyces tritici]
MLRYTIALASLASLLCSVSAFSCPGVTENGFKPVCCMGKDGQVALNCIPAHQMGAENPTWECNAGPPYRSQGCCQSIGYTNPDTGQTPSTGCMVKPTIAPIPPLE